MREWYGAFPDCVPLAEDYAGKLKRSQLNVCNLYVYCVQCSFPPLLLKSVPDWPAVTVLSVVDNSKVWSK